jgi:putative Mg2+ transporter-C (MgtC) family protein
MGLALGEPMDVDLTKGASVIEVVIRLVVACLMGGLIGWDREKSDKPAGLRTHMLVALGSASFTLLGFEVGAHLAPKSGEGFDPTRVLQGVIGGIGFLGAGAIIQNHGHVSGLTTAASVWVAGALGTAAGVGAYVLAGITTVLAFAILALLAKLDVKTRGAQGGGQNGQSGQNGPSSDRDSSGPARPAVAKAPGQ